VPDALFVPDARNELVQTLRHRAPTRQPSVNLGHSPGGGAWVVAASPLLPLDIFDDVETLERLVTSGPAIPEEPTSL
jgi:hypothetical protein